MLARKRQDTVSNLLLTRHIDDVELRPISFVDNEERNIAPRYERICPHTSRSRRSNNLWASCKFCIRGLVQYLLVSMQHFIHSLFLFFFRLFVSVFPLPPFVDDGLPSDVDLAAYPYVSYPPTDCGQESSVTQQTWDTVEQPKKKRKKEGIMYNIWLMYLLMAKVRSNFYEYVANVEAT
ncbi:hypothetical protein GHT06_017771 [Daphnia sinensis]|uniref:Uncharacterized protein n=1 Tax=Daphnia sinensis TaxID=1820382 RepID=A0AAD5PPJ7_9CRUS|nr:hypothetical protein GHT06_017771 [Daphnia sinensis]